MIRKDKSRICNQGLSLQTSKPSAHPSPYERGTRSSEEESREPLLETLLQKQVQMGQAKARPGLVVEAGHSSQFNRILKTHKISPTLTRVQAQLVLALHDCSSDGLIINFCTRQEYQTEAGIHFEFSLSSVCSQDVHQKVYFDFENRRQPTYGD